MHQIVKDTYSWRYVAERTERVYDFVMEQPVLNSFNKLKLALSWGPVVGFYGLLYEVLGLLLFMIVELLIPVEEIDIARGFNTFSYLVNPHSFGDHEFRIGSLAEIKQSKSSGEDKKKRRPHDKTRVKSNRYCTFINTETVPH